jgi:hypothetical protein
MTQEIAQPITSNEEITGLNPEQQEEAIRLLQNISEKESQPTFEPSRTHSSMLSGNTVSGSSVSSLWISDISKGVNHVQVNRAERAAKRHYKKNKGAYQMQALKDAREAGVDINFSYVDPKDIKKSVTRHSAKARLGHAALATANGFVVEQMLSGTATNQPADTKAMRDAVAGYLAYRYGKGAIVRGKAALTGKGDVKMALASPVSAIHPSKKILNAERARAEHIAQRAKHA